MTRGLIVIPQTNYLKSLFTIVRNQKTCRKDFIFYSDQIINLLIQESLNHVSYASQSVMTPTGATADGLRMNSKLCGVSIVRAGEAMEAGLRHVLRGVKIGKILIQRDESTALPHVSFKCD
jgi:uracil phosphoribosyltransferase